MRERLERGDPVVPMFGPLGLAWLQRQAEIAEQLGDGRGLPRPVSRLSAAIPHAASRPTTAPRLGTFLSRTDAVLGKAAEGFVMWCGWHGMQGVTVLEVTLPGVCQPPWGLAWIGGSTPQSVVSGFAVLRCGESAM